MAAALLLVGSPLEAFALGLSGLLWLLWIVPAAYLALLALLAYLPSRRMGPGPMSTRFCILIPAHNEALNLGGVLERLRTLRYSREQVQVVVIADNCSDTTAEVAEQHGARTMVRVDEELRGKGFALEWAMDQLLKEQADGQPSFDAFIIMDADSALSEDFLEIMDARLAHGEHVIQARYDVLNPEDSWRTKLMTCALALVHVARPGGRERLGLSTGLKGNGMCFGRRALETVPWSGASITEDIEYALRLVEGGFRVAFDRHATVWAQMPTTAEQSTTQRERWEGGRYALFRQGLKQMAAGLTSSNPRRFDAGYDLVIPPLVEFVGVAGVAFACSMGWWMFTSSQASAISLGAWAFVIVLQVLYVSIGLAAARIPWSVKSALACAPLYAVWKVVLVAKMALTGGPKGWKRTDRHEMADRS